VKSSGARAAEGRGPRPDQGDGPPAEVLALIPARGGSRSIPRKNIVDFGGHPLIAYSIASAKAAAGVTRTIVSTDNPEIAEVARAYGAETPFLRPAEISRDDTPDLPVFTHALSWLESQEGYRPWAVVHLRPTSPLRPVGFIDHTLDLLRGHPGADCVRCMTESGENPYKMWRQGREGFMDPLLTGEFAEPYNLPRQLLPPTYWQTGNLDLVPTRTIEQKNSLTGENILPVFIERRYVLDIDTAEDLEYGLWRLGRGGLEIDAPFPAAPDRARWSKRPRLVVLDFDGVMTDNRVLVDQDGREAVWCHRADGLGLDRLVRAGVPVAVLSQEENPVVSARCAKLNLECHQGHRDKAAKLRDLALAHGLGLDEVMYVGNDVNDLACLALVGWPVAVADAHPRVLAAARIVLGRAGGRGAVRELCDLIRAGMDNGKERP
jgi:YrbI family 3-deoxy-D-manno-octulosonate 8-phosphate phosphatase